jgi:methionyl-tRNA synthetase
MVTRYRGGVVPDAVPDASLAAEFEGLADEVAELLDRAELTQALERIWERVRRLNRYVEERAPWTLAKEESAAAELDSTLLSLAEGLRVVTLLLLPYMPASCGRLLDAIGCEQRGYAAARFGAGAAGAAVGALEPLFPKS